jgi:ribosomal protein S18 acetylase RimI-like enzyme
VTVLYALEPGLAVEEFQQILTSSSLGERRPADDKGRLHTMLREADIIVTARVEKKLIGVSRAITDFSYCCYLSDLAVDKAFQGQGIGRHLIAETQKAAGPLARLILLSAPAAESYYPHIGMEKHHSCWTLDGKAKRA